jgi:hypothetical protein
VTLSTTFRTDVRVALLASLNSFNATLAAPLKQITRARPASFNPPCAFIGSWREAQIGVDMQLMTRQPTIEVVFVQGTYSNEQTMDRQDVLLDAAVQWFGSNAQAHIASGVIVGMSLGDDFDLTLTGAGGSQATYLASPLALQLDIQSGL